MPGFQKYAERYNQDMTHTLRIGSQIGSYDPMLAGFGLTIIYLSESQIRHPLFVSP
jgi:hypothetical protein